MLMLSASGRLLRVTSLRQRSITWPVYMVRAMCSLPKTSTQAFAMHSPPNPGMKTRSSSA
eukprot:909983-Alexandrium_andersonii.AAC.1